MKIKRTVIIITLFIFLLVVWFIQNRIYNHFTGVDALKLMNNSAFGYSSIQAYTTFYILPFLFFYIHFFLNETPVSISRRKTRLSLYNGSFINIILVSIIFSFIHLLVNVGCTFFLAQDVNDNGSNFILYSFLNMIGISFFYIAVGLIFTAFKDICHSISLAILFSFLIIVSLFFLEKLFLSQIWGPLKDLIILSYLLDDRLRLSDLPIIYFRQLSIIVILYFAGSSIFSRKDIT